MVGILPEWGRLLMAVFAVYRLAQLVAMDEGPGRCFERLRAWAGANPWSPVRESLGKLVHCPYCLGVWFAAACGALVIWPGAIGDGALLVLGLAGAQAFLQEWTHDRSD